MIDAIDYERAKRRHPQLKAALTRAERSGDPEKVVDAVRKAVVEWETWGCWPDDWHRWNIAYQDATMDYRDISEVF